ncbi:MAG: hypothetical protein ACR2NR_00985, partial [Solirubrobacteraceae bacterium]
MAFVAAVTLGVGVLVPIVSGHVRRAGASTQARGGGTSGVLNLHRASALTLALSPDHHSIVMNFLDGLWTLPATGGKATRITSLVQDTAYPDWSPDGKMIAF